MGPQTPQLPADLLLQTVVTTLQKACCVEEGLGPSPPPSVEWARHETMGKKKPLASWAQEEGLSALAGARKALPTTIIPSNLPPWGWGGELAVEAVLEEGWESALPWRPD